MKTRYYFILLIFVHFTGPTIAQQSARTSVSIKLQEKQGKVARATYTHPGAIVFRDFVKGREAATGGSTIRRTEENPAPHEIQGEIRDFAEAYFESGSFLVRNAFRRHLPTLATMRQLFTDPDLADQLSDDYTLTYGDHFHREILDEFKHVDLSRTKVYATTISKITPSALRKDLRDPDYVMYRAEFYLPDDRFKLIGVHPVLTIYFLKMEEELQIFHLQALGSDKIPTR